MSDLRRDPVSGHWVIIAKDRASRPNEFEVAKPSRSNKPCPFCAGNEAETPHEVAVHRAANTHADEPGWRVRVVTNKFPALKLDAFDRSDTLSNPAEPLSVYHAAFGAHEVIIDSPRHLISVSELTPEELADVLAMFRERMLALKTDTRLKHVLVFKNVGPAAGASIEHTHCQLVAMPFPPPAIAQELTNSLAYHQANDRCLFCDLVEEARQAGRIVIENAKFVAFCPFAARFPYETWILPRVHASHFEAGQFGASHCEASEPADFTELSQSLHEIIRRLDELLDRPSYNYMLHTAPFDTAALSHYHWHIEVIPRVTTTAGFEWGSGCFINPVPPEEAASSLRGKS